MIDACLLTINTESDTLFVLRLVLPCVPPSAGHPAAGSEWGLWVCFGRQRGCLSGKCPEVHLGKPCVHRGAVPYKACGSRHDGNICGCRICGGLGQPDLEGACEGGLKWKCWTCINVDFSMFCAWEIFPEPLLLVPEPIVYSLLKTLEDGPITDPDGNQEYGDLSVVAHS